MGNQIGRICKCDKIKLLILQIYYRETDKQHICVTMQLKNRFTQFNLKDRVLLRRRKSVSKQIFVYGYCTFWARRCISVTTSPRRMKKPFTVPVILFNKRQACLNDHCLKWRHAANGKEKYRSIHRKMQSSTIFAPRTPHQKQRSILNNVLDDSVTDSTAFDYVNKIVNSSFDLKVHRNQRATPVVV